MHARKPEKTAWMGGWLGAFVWVLGLAVVFLVQGKTLQGSIGLLLACAAGAAIAGDRRWIDGDTRP